MYKIKWMKQLNINSVAICEAAFMIIRSKLSSQVCLRCQLRLFGQLRAGHPRASATVSLQGQFRGLSLHATSQLAQAHDDPQNKKSEVRNSDPASESSNHGSTTRASSSAPDASPKVMYQLGPHNRVSSVPLGRIYGIGGSKLSQRTEELPVDSLGRPTEVIVLRGDQTLRYVAPRPIEETIEAPVVDVLAQFNSERGLIGRDEVNQNIETLRPQERVVSWKDIRDIEDQLGDGFTMTQLLYYIESTERQRMAAVAKDDISGTTTSKAAKKKTHNKAHNKEEGGPEEISQPTSKSRYIKAKDIILKQSRWMPGTSDQGDHFDESSLRGYISDAFTPKQRVAMNIIRLCWGIESKELTSSVGEIELKVNSADLDLLLSPSK